MSWNTKCHEMSWNGKCHEMPNIMKCQMLWNAKCHKMSNVMKCKSTGRQFKNTFDNTVEKSRTNATNVTLHHLIYAILGDIWKRTLETNQTNASNATKLSHMQAIWGDIWKYTLGKCILSSRRSEGTFANTQWIKVTQMQTMWLCLSSGRRFEDTFKTFSGKKFIYD